MPKSYSRELRESIITLCNQGNSIKSLAKEYDISSNTISRWLKQEEKIEVNGKQISYEKYVELEKKLAKSEEEIEILKRAAVLLGKH